MGSKADLETPVGRRHIIERPRLTRLLDETSARVIMLVAPAGYGKTTLARQWLAKPSPRVVKQALAPQTWLRSHSISRAQRRPVPHPSRNVGGLVAEHAGARETGEGCGEVSRRTLQRMA